MKTPFAPAFRRLRRLGPVAVVLTGTALAACGTNQTGLGVNLVPEQQVAEMAAQSWTQIRTDSPASDNQAYQEQAERVAGRLLRAGGKDPAQWEVVVFQGDAVNAFALPNGKIGVYEGMMDFAETEDQLAAVIGHEIAHNEASHAQERVNSQVAAQTGASIAGNLLGSAGLGDPRQVAAVLGAGVQYGMLLPYGRNQELEADRMGLSLMREAGYDPRAAVALWRKMAREQGGGGPSFLSTHPAPEERVRQLEAML